MWLCDVKLFFDDFLDDFRLYFFRLQSYRIFPKFDAIPYHILGTLTHNLTYSYSYHILTMYTIQFPIPQTITDKYIDIVINRVVTHDSICDIDFEIYVANNQIVIKANSLEIINDVHNVLQYGMTDPRQFNMFGRSRILPNTDKEHWAIRKYKEEALNQKRKQLALQKQHQYALKRAKVTDKKQPSVVVHDEDTDSDSDQ